MARKEMRGFNRSLHLGFHDTRFHAPMRIGVKQ
jgi:hypothetical protein